MYSILIFQLDIFGLFIWCSIMHFWYSSRCARAVNSTVSVQRSFFFICLLVHFTQLILYTMPTGWCALLCTNITHTWTTIYWYEMPCRFRMVWYWTAYAIFFFPCFFFYDIMDIWMWWTKQTNQIECNSTKCTIQWMMYTMQVFCVVCFYIGTLLYCYVWNAFWLY